MVMEAPNSVAKAARLEGNNAGSEAQATDSTAANAGVATEGATANVAGSVASNGGIARGPGGPPRPQANRGGRRNALPAGFKPNEDKLLTVTRTLLGVASANTVAVAGSNVELQTELELRLSRVVRLTLETYQHLHLYNIRGYTAQELDITTDLRRMLFPVNGGQDSLLQCRASILMNLISHRRLINNVERFLNLLTEIGQLAVTIKRVVEAAPVRGDCLIAIERLLTEGFVERVPASFDKAAGWPVDQLAQLYADLSDRLSKFTPNNGITKFALVHVYGLTKDEDRGDASQSPSLALWMRVAVTEANRQLSQRPADLFKAGSETLELFDLAE
jgi:hypothetical protein